MSRFAIFPATVYDDRRLTPHLRDVLGLLSTYASQSGWCWPAQETLARRLGVTRQCIGQHIGKLVELGYIESRRRRGSSMYRVIFDLPIEPSEVEMKVGLSPTGKPGFPLGESGAFIELPKGNIPNELSKRGCRLPDDWEASPELIAWAIEKYPYVAVEAEAEKFTLYWSAANQASAVKRDWDKAFKVWIINGANRYGTASHAANGPIRNGRPGTETTEDRRRKLADAVGGHSQ